jgi:hypothetical protein
MRKIRTKSLPDNCVVLSTPAYLRLMALATESGRDPGELLTIAVTVFAHAVENVTLIHPNRRPRDRAAKPGPIAATRPINQQQLPIASIGSVVMKFVRKVKEVPPCEKPRQRPARNRRS